MAVGRRNVDTSTRQYYPSRTFTPGLKSFFPGSRRPRSSARRSMVLHQESAPSHGGTAMSKKKKQKKEKKRKKRGVENLLQIVGANGNGSTGGEQPPQKLKSKFYLEQLSKYHLE